MLPARFLARPLIGPPISASRSGCATARVAIHHFLDHLPDSRETHPAIEKCCDRDFIGGVQDSRQRAARFAGLARQIERRKIVVTRRGELELRQFSKIERRQCSSERAPATSPRIESENTCRNTQLREHRAVREFDHRMHDALRMNHDFDSLHLHAEKPMRLDHLQPFVEECGGIDRDLRTHVPGRMLERLFDGDDRQICSPGSFAERSAGCGQNDPRELSESARPSRH